MALNHGWQVTAEFAPVYPSPAVKAAVLVLLAAGGGPMHYRAIAAAAVKAGLWEPRGPTPWHTLNSDIRTDIGRAQALGAQSVFVRTGGGMVAIAYSGRLAVDQRAPEARELLKSQLLQHALELHPRAFEELMAELIRRMGYTDVAVTRYSGDGGVDVTATFDCGPLAQQRFVFQVKRVRRPLGQRLVRELRGVLEEDERGVLISTGTFHPAARRLAERWRRPLALVDGHRLAGFLIEHELGVRRVPMEAHKVVGFSGRASQFGRGVAAMDGAS
jgi:hypothetical protein